MSAAQHLDHGVLNIPGRLNTIDRDLDRYKAEKALEAKKAAKATGSAA